MLRLLSRRKPTSASPVIAGAEAGIEDGFSRPAVPEAAVPVDMAPGADRVPTASTACALSACVAGSRATVLEVRCGDADACRLRALGLCEGASVSVVRSRDCTLLEVRGARLAVGSAIAAGIVVLPVL